jgi:imidazolonepropionase-like amidohydrolase
MSNWVSDLRGDCPKRNADRLHELDRRRVEVIDAGGQWIMPGLIDAHCHVSYVCDPVSLTVPDRARPMK